MIPREIFVFTNMNVAVIDEDREQVPELQESLIVLFAEHAVSKGYDPEGWVIKTPHGNWRLYRTSDGRWNYEVAV